MSAPELRCAAGGGRGGDFVLWCIFGTLYASYASAWVCSSKSNGDVLLILPNQDLLMDWSVLRPHGKYPLLREGLMYTNHIPVRLKLS